MQNYIIYQKQHKKLGELNKIILYVYCFYELKREEGKEGGEKTCGNHEMRVVHGGSCL
jgi:hypothetical protein